MPSVNERALTIFCGHPAKECTIQKWLDFMGDTSNEHTPFMTNYTMKKSMLRTDDLFFP
jgi:predicted metal-binding transcription factor (methanogenesis marker protein 9)